MAVRGSGRSRTYGPSARAPEGEGRQVLHSAAVDGDRLVVAETRAGADAPQAVSIAAYPLGAFSSTRPRQAACV
jgi:hypothetical protein